MTSERRLENSAQTPTTVAQEGLEGVRDFDQLSGCTWSDNPIVRNETAATATPIDELLALSVSLKEMATCIAGSKPAAH